MGQYDGIFWVFVMLIGGIVWFFKGFGWFRQKRLVEDIPTSKVRSIAMGMVELYGAVVPKQVLTSPLTNKECVYYKYDVAEWRQHGKSGSWHTIKSGTKLAPFFLADETGKVLVDLKDAEIDMPCDYSWSGGTFKNPPEIVLPFLKQNKIVYKGFLGMHKSLRFQEWYIEPQERIYIMGTAGKNPHVKKATSVQHEDAIMIQKGTANPLYYVSDKSEKEVRSRLMWKTIGGFIGGGALIVISVGMLYMYFTA